MQKEKTAGLQIAALAVASAAATTEVRLGKAEGSWSDSAAPVVLLHLGLLHGLGLLITGSESK
jgi:hypothetical protein